MKSVVMILLIIAALSPLASAFERELEEERRLGYKSRSPSQRFAKYLSINDRCCGDDTSQCRCWVRNSKWFKRKWARSCSPGGSIKNKSSLVALAASNPKFSTLVKLVKRVGLVDVLNGEGPFTVFAPTNAAFEVIGQKNLDDLDDDALRDILLYHVVPGKVLSTDLTNGLEAGTALSKPDSQDKRKVDFTFQNGGISINDSVPIILDLVDLLTSNGVVHVIGGVLLPPAQ